MKLYRPLLRTDPTYKEWKLVYLYSHALTSFCLARILPTRNGNLSHWRNEPNTLARTDPTYKEWKLEKHGIDYYENRGTDPTYKEWKHGYGNL